LSGYRALKGGRDMCPRVSRWSGIILALLFLVAAAAGQQKEPNSGQPRLEEILARCAEYCRKLENSVLDFVCQETIREEIYQPSFVKVRYGGITEREAGLDIANKRVARNEFVYDYQLIRKEGETLESRTLVRENGRKKEEKNAQLKTSGYTFKNIIFGPVVLLGEAWQSKHDYEILREEAVLGKRTVVIKVTPKPNEWLGYLYGTVWVGKEDSAILKIEWSQESIGNYRQVELSALNLGLQPDIVLSGDYSYEKNGIRFPSAFSIIEAYRYAPKSKFTLYKLAATFTAYKFFTVETEVKY
jgi:hypothetical protein